MHETQSKADVDGTVKTHDQQKDERTATRHRLRRSFYRRFHVSIPRVKGIYRADVLSNRHGCALIGSIEQIVRFCFLSVQYLAVFRRRTVH